MSPSLERVLLAVWSAVSFVAAAKTHGRQVRLERELAGVFSVTFGARNPPVVEALWQRDRGIYWPAAVGFAALAVAAMIAAVRFRWAIPVADVRGQRAWWGAAVVGILWAMNAAFLTAGAASLARLARAWPAAAAATVPAGWSGRALWGSVFWWALAFTTAVSLAGWAFVRRAP